MAKFVIETDKLTKYYGKHLGVENLTLEVKQGEIFGFLGPNGAGKSTTIKLLLNFIKPSSGNIRVLGKDPTKEIVEINTDIGYLAGEVHMYEQMSGKDQLQFLAKLKHNVDWTYVEELSTRLQANLKKPIRSLSHGNKQKIALIAALMGKPKLLILDEPTTGLDPLIQQEFYKIVEESNKAGSTVFVSSHILPEVERLCHRVGIIREGKLVLTDDIVTLKKQAVRPIEVYFKTTPKKSDFESISGVKDLSINENILRCTIKGSYDDFIKQISQYEVENLITQEPDLEKIFLGYYKKD